jgi:hypothetical protein
MNAPITIDKTMHLGLAGTRSIIPVENIDRDGVSIVRIQYLSGGHWESGEIPRAILQDLANSQALHLSLAERNRSAVVLGV